MKTWGWGVLGLGWALAAAGGTWADDPPKDAKALLQKAVKSSISQEGYHFKLKSSSQAASAAAGALGGGAGNPSGIDATGLYKKPGICRLSDAAIGEIWMKGRKVLVQPKGQSEWKVPDSLGPVGATVSRLVRTPNDLAEDMVRLSGTAKLEGEEKLEQLDCWVVSTVGDKAAVQAFVKQLTDRAGGLGAAFFGTAQFDTEKADFTYRAWIGKDDGLLYRIENKANIPMKAGGNPLLGGGANIDQNTTAEYLAYNRDLEVEVPAEVKRKLGIK